MWRVFCRSNDNSALRFDCVCACFISVQHFCSQGGQVILCRRTPLGGMTSVIYAACYSMTIIMMGSRECRWAPTLSATVMTSATHYSVLFCHAHGWFICPSRGHNIVLSRQTIIAYWSFPISTIACWFTRSELYVPICTQHTFRTLFGYI